MRGHAIELCKKGSTFRLQLFIPKEWRIIRKKTIIFAKQMMQPFQVGLRGTRMRPEAIV